MKRPTDAEAQNFIYQALVHCHIDLAQEWHGWRIRGRFLVSPDGDRITVERLRGVVFREALKSKPARAKVHSAQVLDINVLRMRKAQ